MEVIVKKREERNKQERGVERSKLYDVYLNGGEALLYVQFVRKIRSKKGTINVGVPLIMYGEFIENDKYTVRMKIMKKGEERIMRLEKLRIKFLVFPQDSERLARAVGTNLQIKEKSLFTPTEKEKRFKPPEEILKEGKGVKATFVGGEVLQGKITWLGDFEFEMEIDMGHDFPFRVLCFKHALVGLEPVS